MGVFTSKSCIVEEGEMIDTLILDGAFPNGYKAG